MQRSRSFLPGALLSALFILVCAGTASAGTPIQVLPTGSELGAKWKSTGSETVDIAGDDGVPDQFKATVTGGARRDYSRRPSGDARQTLGISVYTLTHATAAGAFYADLEQGLSMRFAGAYPFAFPAVGERSVARRFPYSVSGRRGYRANEVAFVVRNVVARAFISQRAARYPTVSTTKAVAARLAAKIAATP